MSRWRTKSDQMAPDVAEAIDEQLLEIRVLAARQGSDPHLTGILLACFGRLEKTAQDNGLPDLAEVAAAPCPRSS